MKDIRVITLDKDGFETDNRDFETVKQARQWVKECGLDSGFWERRAESAGFGERNVDTIQLHIDGECTADWFPKWASHETSAV